MKPTVTVELTLVVKCTGNWADDCSIAQVKKQAKEQALDLARRSIDKDPLVDIIKVGEVTLSAEL